MPAIHLAVEELGCKVFEVQHASRDHSEGVARLGEVDALLVLEYGQVAWSQELTECLVQARRKLPTCLPLTDPSALQSGIALVAWRTAGAVFLNG